MGYPEEYPERHCQAPECGKLLVPRISLKGIVESIVLFNERRYCNTQCYWKDSSVDKHATLCLAGDTEIPLLNGTEVTLAELSITHESKPFWVYSCNDKGMIVPSLARLPRKMGIKQAIVAVELDNGEIIKCTNNHPFLTRNGTYVEAQNLQPDDSLMPLYRKLNDDVSSSGYEMVLQPYTGKWHFTHWMVGEQYGYHGDMVIHHKDFNKLNNDPNNLQLMTWKDHTDLHSFQTVVLQKYAQSERGREKSRELMNKLWNDPEWAKKALERIRANGKTTCFRYMQKGKFGFGEGMSKEMNSELGREYGAKNIVLAHNVESRQRGSDSWKLRLITDPKFCEQVAKRARENLQKYNQALASGEVQVTENQRNARRNNALHTAYNRFHKHEFATFEEYDKHRLANAPTNHKVVSIKPVESEDVYDLTVDEHHNFAVSQGVFVHNCVG